VSFRETELTNLSSCQTRLLKGHGTPNSTSAMIGLRSCWAACSGRADRAVGQENGNVIGHRHRAQPRGDGGVHRTNRIAKKDSHSTILYAAFPKGKSVSFQWDSRDNGVNEFG